MLCRTPGDEGKVALEPGELYNRNGVMNIYIFILCDLQSRGQAVRAGHSSSLETFNCSERFVLYLSLCDSTVGPVISVLKKLKNHVKTTNFPIDLTHPGLPS